LVESKMAVVDPVIASRTLLCALGEMVWDEELLALFGIPAETLPAIVPSNYRFGTVALGGRAIALVLVGGDQSFIPFSCGAHADAETAFANIGTGAFIQTLATDLAAVDPRQLCSLAVRTVGECIIVAEGTVNAASTALDWLWQMRGKSLDYRELAAAVDAVDSPPLFINTLLGTGSPDWLPQKEPELIPPGATLAEEAVAVIESIVRALSDNFFLLRKANPKLRRIIASGGLSSLDGFCQKLANCCGVEVLRPEHPEASARGAALYLMQKKRAGGNPARRFVPTNQSSGC
jgi:glycerol kinase